MVSLGLGLLIAVACTQPDTPAVVRQLPMQPPSIVNAIGEHGTAELIVSLTPASPHAANVTVSRSSGSAIIDAAALRVAREAQFAPETQACTPVSGRYFFDVEY